MQNVSNVGMDEMNALQALLAMTGEDFVSLVTFTDEADALAELEELTR